MLGAAGLINDVEYRVDRESYLSRFDDENGRFAVAIVGLGDVAFTDFTLEQGFPVGKDSAVDDFIGEVVEQDDGGVVRDVFVVDSDPIRFAACCEQ